MDDTPRIFSPDALTSVSGLARLKTNHHALTVTCVGLVQVGQDRRDEIPGGYRDFGSDDVIDLENAGEDAVSCCGWMDLGVP